MAVVDVAHKTITLKIVYYGCAMGGKTTNLVTLHRLTDPQGQQGLLSIATQDDRTLFFDLLPMELGRVGGLTVRVKVYTVPGQVHYETTRRQVLAGADAVVFVVDSNPEFRKANVWAAENLKHNLKVNGLDPATTPTIVQWNKRDLANARPVDEMQPELNPGKLPSVEAIATTGMGVVDSFATALKAGMVRAYAKAKHAEVSEQTIGETVDRALREARAREPKGPPVARTTFDRRVDMAAYQQEWEEKGRNRQVMDLETLLGESVKSSMEMAERLDGFKQSQALNERRGRMMEALSRIAPMLADPREAAVPEGLLQLLLAGAGRQRGSVLLFKPGQQVMDERDVVPPCPDALNAAVAAGLGSAAHRLCQTTGPRWIEDLVGEVFFDSAPPGAENLASAYIAPLGCDGLTFGGLVVYGQYDEKPFDAAEREYWNAASRFVGLSLHWRALRQKVKAAETGEPAQDRRGQGMSGARAGGRPGRRA